MSFASPLGLLALLAVAAVLALHLFRRKFRERRVAGLFLFAPDALTAPSGRRRTRLLRTASLWLELGAAACLGLWLGGFDLGTATEERHLVFVVDDSASIAAADQGGVSCADRVRQRVGELLEDEPAGAMATVILTGPRPEILVGPRALRAAVAPALRDWRPWRPGHDPQPALDLALELTHGSDELHYLTDRETPDLPPPSFALHALGVAAPNAAILSARKRGGGQSVDQLFVDVMAWAPSPVRDRLSVRIGARELAARDIECEPQKVLHLKLEIPPTPAAITVALQGGDALSLDDAFTLLPEPRRVVRVATDGLAEDAAERLMLARAARALPQVRLTEQPSRAQLVFRSAATPLSPGRSEVVLGAIGAGNAGEGAEEGARDAWIGPYLIERRHPLGSGLSLDGVVWTAGRGDLAGVPLALAGSQALASVESLDASMRVWLNVDFGRSNLAASPDWPILLENLVEGVRELLPGSLAVNVPVGELMQWREAGGADAVCELRLEDPDGRLRPGRGVRLVSWTAARPGIHRLLRGDQELERYSVQFVDPHESDLRRARTVRRDAAAVDARPERFAAQAGTTAGPEARLLALLVLLALVADWWVLGPRAGRIGRHRAGRIARGVAP